MKYILMQIVKVLSVCLTRFATTDNSVFPKSERYECSNQTSGIREPLYETVRKRPRSMRELRAILLRW